MVRLAAILYILTASVFAGSAVIGVLSMEMTEASQIAIAFVSGLVLALPVSLIVARNVYTAFTSRGA